MKTTVTTTMGSMKIRCWNTRKYQFSVLLIVFESCRIHKHIFAQQQPIQVYYNSSGNVYIHDLTSHMASFDTPGLYPNTSPLLHTIKHKVEGYALAWSRSSQLLSADTGGDMKMTVAVEGGWTTSRTWRHEGGASVEDMVWSPAQDNVFATGAADGTVRIWDARAEDVKIGVKAHETDVNCIGWNG